VRTSINVLGDAFGAGIVDYYVKDQLMLSDAEHRRQSQQHNAENIVAGKKYSVPLIRGAIVNDDKMQLQHNSTGVGSGGYRSVPTHDENERP